MLLGLGALGATGCSSNNDSNDGDPPEGSGDEATDAPLIISFSGGGYHALSGAAAWMMGMMERDRLLRPGETSSLESVTKNVDAIGSNSGGSWFVGLSMYSCSFLDELQKEGSYAYFAAAPEAAKIGYMTRVWELIGTGAKANCDGWPAHKSTICNTLADLLVALGSAGMAHLIQITDGEWQTGIERAVYGKDAKWPYYGEVKSKTLRDTPLWAAGKDHVMLGTLLTQVPSLTYKTYDDKTKAYQGVQAYGEHHHVT